MTPPFKVNDATPFVIFDCAPAYGVANGIVQITLAARRLSPTPEDQVAVDYVSVLHLRCSGTGARFLRNAIDEALKMLEAHPEISSEAGKLN